MVVHLYPVPCSAPHFGMLTAPPSVLFPLWSCMVTRLTTDTGSRRKATASLQETRVHPGIRLSLPQETPATRITCGNLPHINRGVVVTVCLLHKEKQTDVVS